MSIRLGILDSVIVVIYLVVVVVLGTMVKRRAARNISERSIATAGRPTRRRAGTAFTSIS